MNVNVFAVLILMAAGVGLSEVYHARQRAMMRALRGRPMARASRRSAVHRKAATKRVVPIDWLFRAAPYPAPAARLYQPHEKVLRLEGWSHQDSLRKHTQRWQVRDGRAG